MKRRELLIIDGQNDFCEPEGALYVNGADEDCRRLADFLRRKGSSIEGITITLDSHHLYDIAHPLYWIDADGNHPDPFTLITTADVESGKWKTARPEEAGWGLDYVRTLEKQGKYTLCIWPPHCLIGSWGTQLQKDIYTALTGWEESKLMKAEKIFKGDNPATEHYGAFEAEVPGKDDDSARLSRKIIAKLDQADEILIAGEALDYCVANTVRQLADALPSGKTDKIVLLEDCCSSVDRGSGLSDSFLTDMKARGIKVKPSTEI